MAYLSIKDFKYGMDRRRPQVAGIPGTLWLLVNAVITRGGDIEHAKKWVPTYTLPAGTKGLAVRNGQVFVFGSGAAPGGLPIGVQYQQLVSPFGAALTEILDAKAFDGMLYVIAEYADGNIYHFYNGTRVTDWDTIGASNSSFDRVAAALARKITANAAVEAQAFANTIQITGATPGTAVTVSASASDDGGTTSTPTAAVALVQAAVAAAAEVVSTGTVTVTGGSAAPGANRVTQIAVAGEGLLAGPVDWISSNSATANALVVAINNNSAVSGYTAAADGAVVTISAAPGTGATPNGLLVEVATGGDVTATAANMAGGSAAVAAVAPVYTVTISGASFDADDTWSVVVEGTTYRSTGRAAGTGTALFIHKNRVWSTGGSLLFYCSLNAPLSWVPASTPATDGGNINMSNDSDGSIDLIGAAKYNGLAAIFSRDTILLYALETDATQISGVDTLENTGSMAARSIVPYGNTDVYYLADTGIRSIGARSQTDTAYVNDIGSAIDIFAQEVMAAADEYTLARATAVIDPLDGRYMVAIGGKVIALSYFPASKITAWSYLEPGFAVQDMVRSARSIYARSGDTIYIYGGADGQTYPGAGEVTAQAVTPFMDADDPAHKKDLLAFDIACAGTWNVHLLVDPNNTQRYVDIGALSGATYNLPDIPAVAQASHIALRLTCKSGGRATISNVAVHFKGGDDDE